MSLFNSGENLLRRLRLGFVKSKKNSTENMRERVREKFEQMLSLSLINHNSHSHDLVVKVEFWTRKSFINH